MFGALSRVAWVVVGVVGFAVVAGGRGWGRLSALAGWCLGLLRWSRGSARAVEEWVGLASGCVEASERVEQVEEDAEPWVVGEDSPADGAGGLDDLAGDVDERLLEGAELDREQPASLLFVLLCPAG
jgi:hypothetical protein